MRGSLEQICYSGLLAPLFPGTSRRLCTSEKSGLPLPQTLLRAISSCSLVELLLYTLASPSLNIAQELSEVFDEKDLASVSSLVRLGRLPRHSRWPDATYQRSPHAVARTLLQRVPPRTNPCLLETHGSNTFLSCFPRYVLPVVLTVIGNLYVSPHLRLF